MSFTNIEVLKMNIFGGVEEEMAKIEKIRIEFDENL